MLNELLHRYPQLNICEEELKATVTTLIACYQRGGKLLLCGNGGSCADCDHIVGELMKGFHKKRPLSNTQKATLRTNAPILEEELIEGLQGGLPAISLSSLTALNSAVCNDTDPRLVYAQPLLALGREGDVLLAISTSGNAANVVAAAQVAKGLGLTVIALTGQDGGALATVADIAVKAPETATYRVQEMHLPIYHFLCSAVEDALFPTA